MSLGLIYFYPHGGNYNASYHFSNHEQLLLSIVMKGAKTVIVWYLQQHLPF